MQKRNRGNRATARSFDMHGFLSCVLRDTARELGPESLGRLTASLVTDPGSFRGVVDEELALAETPDLPGQQASKYIVLRQIQGLLKKNPDWHAKEASERQEAAYAKFLISEDKCKRANKRIDWFSKHWSRGKFPTEVLNQASLYVQEYLGLLDQEVEDEILEQCKFGSGATFLHSTAEASPYYKLDRKHTVTKEAIPLLAKWFRKSPNISCWMTTQSYELVRGNRLSVVPKDWDIDRMIAIEPSWNIFLQLGLNGWLVQRLKKFGIALDDQSKGYYFAREGSISGAYATIDLSSASDTISVALVKKLLPKKWFELFDSLRSKEYFYKGEWKTYHKFSSMGNGFTFPLESLIFHALARASALLSGASSKGIVVYGDDIITHQTNFCPLMESLRFAGFEPNTKKSFGFGSFRETCGRDFRQGINVRPVYLRSTPRCDADIYSIYNRLLMFSLVPLPETLDYLRGLIKSPLVGPGFIPNTNADKKVRTWKELVDPAYGIIVDQFFVSEPPERRVWSVDLQSYVFTYQHLSKVPKVDKQASDEYLRYLCFLLGITGGIIKSSQNIKTRVRFAKTTFWPSVYEARRLSLALLA